MFLITDRLADYQTRLPDFQQGKVFPLSFDFENKKIMIGNLVFDQYQTFHTSGRFYLNQLIDLLEKEKLSNKQAIYIKRYRKNFSAILKNMSKQRVISVDINTIEKKQKRTPHKSIKLDKLYKDRVAIQEKQKALFIFRCKLLREMFQNRIIYHLNFIMHEMFVQSAHNFLFKYCFYRQNPVFGYGSEYINKNYRVIHHFWRRERFFLDHQDSRFVNLIPFCIELNIDMSQFYKIVGKDVFFELSCNTISKNKLITHAFSQFYLTNKKTHYSYYFDKLNCIDPIKISLFRRLIVKIKSVSSFHLKNIILIGNKLFQYNNFRRFYQFLLDLDNYKKINSFSIDMFLYNISSYSFRNKYTPIKEKYLKFSYFVSFINRGLIAKETSDVYWRAIKNKDYDYFYDQVIQYQEENNKIFR